MRSDFEPIFLKEASKHLDWIISNFREDEKNLAKREKSFFAKFISFLKRVF